MSSPVGLIMPYIEKYKINGLSSFLIDNLNQVWYNGCKITAAHFSIDTARKKVFEYAKAELKRRIKETSAVLKSLREVNSTLKEPFDLRTFKVKSS